MKMKKLLVVALAVLMLFCFAACGGDDDQQAAGGEGYKIAIISTAAGIDDGSFIQNTYEGIMDFVEARGNIDTVTDIMEPTGDNTAAVQAVADVVAEYDIIVTPGFQFAGVSDIAAENPDKYFILIDEFPASEIANMVGLKFAEQEGGFLAGIAAALSSESGKVASVHGIAYESNVNYQYGFASGVNYANAHYGTNAEVIEIASYAGTDITGANVGGNYVGSFGDEATAKVIAEALIAQGVDVIFPAAGASGNGVFTAAKENNIYVIGCDADQYDDGANGDSNIILTSALKCMDIAVKAQLDKIADGTFEGGSLTLTAANDAVNYVSAEGRQQLSEEAISALNEVLPLLKDGTVVPASNFNGHTPDISRVCKMILPKGYLTM